MPIHGHYFNPVESKGLIGRLRTEGAVCIPSLVKGDVLATIQSELLPENGEPQPVEIGSVGVRQHFTRIPMPGALSVTHDVCISLELLINDALRTDGYSGDELHFNDFRIQRYEAGSPGVTPHLDFKSDRGLIALLSIVGEARFCVCEDRDGRGARQVRSDPGDLILMRGYGFLGIEERPMHFVDSIRSTRISIGLRCKVE